MHSKLKTLLNRPDINLSGLVKLAGLTVGVSAVRQWLNQNKPLAQSQIRDLESYCSRFYGYKPEEDLYIEIEKVIKTISDAIQIFELVRDFERDLSNEEKQIQKILYLVSDIIASTEFIMNDSRSFDGETFRFGISAENVEIVKEILNK